MRRASITLVLAALITVGLPPAAAAHYSPGAGTVLLDHLDGATLGQSYGSVSYVPSAPGLDRGADLGLGDYIKYALPGWYQWTHAYDPAGKSGTVEAWVRPRNHGVTLVQLQWNNTTTPAPAGYIGSVGLTPDGHLYWTAWTSIAGPAPAGPSTNPTGGSVIPLGAWTHVAVTWSPTGTSLYVNGILDAFTPGNWYPALNSTFYVYLDNWGVQDLGALDEVRISSVARSEAEIRAHVLEAIDATPPTASPERSPAANGMGWNNTDVTVTWNWADDIGGPGIDPANCTTSSASLGEGASMLLQATCTDLAGNEGSATYEVMVDKTAPMAAALRSPISNANGWSNTDVLVSFSGTDGLSGIAGCAPDATLSTDGAGQFASGTCTDVAGNISDPTTVADINIDKAPPDITWGGGPADGGIYTFGSVPSAPSCEAIDALSGPAMCDVTGYQTTVGTHTLTAKAADRADNTTTQTRSYTVAPWSLQGFYHPVDMNSVWNVVKNGSTVPLKFQVFADTTEITSTSVVTAFAVRGVACPSGGAATDDIEFTTTGGTTLRYDTSSGQFIQNWQTPRRAGACYSVTMTTLDGSSLVALFRLR